ncbi:MAG: hypothetical protein WCI11_14090 [Candidatus Methylumidiphilus sp.]
MQTHSSQIFALFGARDADKLDEAVERVFKNCNYQIATGQWLIKSDTSQPAEVYKDLLGDGQPISCVIVMMAGYYGLHNKAVWDWLEANQRGE